MFVTVEWESNIFYLDIPRETEIYLALKIDNGVEDSLTYVNRLHEKDLLNHIKNKVLGNFRKELKTYI